MPAREAAAAALKQLGEAIGVASRARCAAAYRAYRLSAAPALQGEAQRRLSPEMLGALLLCHHARRSGGAIGADAVRDLWECSEQLAVDAADHDELNAAWAAIELTALRRPARRWLGDRAQERACARDCKRGWGKIEREVREDPLLPPSFRANPAQHFYALQLAMADRRRQQWREACDREPDAFELAA